MSQVRVAISIDVRVADLIIGSWVLSEGAALSLELILLKWHFDIITV